MKKTYININDVWIKNMFEMDYYSDDISYLYLDEIFNDSELSSDSVWKCWNASKIYQF